MRIQEFQLFLENMLTGEILILLAFAYGIGSIPFGLILTKKYFNKNIKEKGSGNIGATNVLRVTNKKLAALTLFLDSFKGVLPVLLAKSLQAPNDIAIFVGFMAVIGHCYPLWLRFSGGKGVATCFGVMFIFNLNIALLSLVVFLFVLICYKKVDISSMIASLSILLFSILWINTGIQVLIICIMIIIIILRHKKNIEKILKLKR